VRFLTSLDGQSAPAAMAVAEDVVAQLLVLLRRPQALPVLHLGLLARLAPHCLLVAGRTGGEIMSLQRTRAPTPSRRKEGRKERYSLAKGIGGELALWYRARVALRADRASCATTL
jgi:hypothetical protein